MSVIFKPSGSLDCSTAATDLPQSGDGGTTVSDALSRAKNLTNDRRGFVELRAGSSAVGSSLAEAINSMTVQAGVRYSFSSTKIYKDESAIASSLGSGNDQYAAIQYNQYNDASLMVYACNGSVRKRIDNATVYEWGIEPPSEVATLGVGTGSGLTGTYYAKYTYCRKVSGTVVSESNPSPISSSQAMSNQALRVTWTASSDAQVTHVRVYRTLADDLNFYHDQDIAIGTVTVDTTTTDANLGGLVPSNNDRPPSGSDLCIGPLFGGYVFIAKNNLLYFSSAKQPEYFPATNFLEIAEPQDPITAMTIHEGQLYVATARKLFIIQGTVSASFAAIPIESKTGTPNSLCLVGVVGTGLFHLGPDGIYLLSGGVDRKITQLNFEPLFSERVDATVNEFEGMLTVKDDSKRWFFVYQNKFFFHYSTGAVLVFNTDQQKWTYYKYDQQLTAPAYDDTNKEFLVGTIGKTVRQLEDVTSTTDAGTAIAWELQSKEFTLQTRRHFPRWVKYDVDLSTDVTGNLNLDGTTHQSHTLSTDRKTKRRLVKTGNGRRMSINLTGSGSATVFAVEAE